MIEVGGAKLVEDFAIERGEEHFLMSAAMAVGGDRTIRRACDGIDCAWG